MAMSGANGGGRSGGRRGRRRGGGNEPMSEINVTPMVDVMLVLLIVFMVAAPLLTVGVPIDLPKTQAKELNTDSKPVTVTVTPEGSIFLLDKPVTLDALVAQLTPLTPGGTDDRIYLRGDATANYGAVMKVMGVLSKAGYSKMRHPASRFALTGVFVVKTKAGDIRVAATGASQNGVMRVPAIEAALKANWSAGALDSLKISEDGLLTDIHGSSAYRANLIKVMAQRAVTDAG